MESPKRTFILIGILALMILAMVIVWGRSAKPPKPAPTGGQFYYTGPMRNKGNPRLFTTDDGQVAKPPPGVSLEPTSPTKAADPDAKVGGSGDAKGPASTE